MVNLNSPAGKRQGILPCPPNQSKMPAKLFLYKAAKANVVAILRRESSSKENWELIRWDLDTDTFTEGQWLMKKQMNGKYAAISPCGRFFAYHYNIYHKGDWACHGVVSSLPNFTALYYNEKHMGNWEMVRFTEDSEIRGPPMVKKGNMELAQVSSTKEKAPSGYINMDTEPFWTDPKGRIITTENGKLLADGVVLYDTTDHVFSAKTPQ